MTNAEIKKADMLALHSRIVDLESEGAGESSEALAIEAEIALHPGRIRRQRVKNAKARARRLDYVERLRRGRCY